MKMLKKVTAVLVVLLLVLGTMSIGVCAEGEPRIAVSIRADKSQNVYPGDIVTFTVNISTNFNYTSMRWPVMYTLKAFEPVIGNDGNGDSDYGNVVGHGALEIDNSFLESSEAATNEPFGDGYSKANYGCLLIQWTGGTYGNSVNCYHEENGADCLTFQMRVKSGYTANSGVGTVVVPTTDQAKSLFYLEGITTPTNANSAFHISLDDLVFTSTPAQVGILREQAGIVPKGDTVIETVEATSDGLANGVAESATINYIYGFNSVVTCDDDPLGLDKANILKYVTLTGNAQYELWSLDELDNPSTWDPDAEKLISTGAKLKLFDANGTFLDEYTFVFFGDFNGDGISDGMDSSILIDAYLYMEEWSWYGLKDNPTFFSCDINGDGMVASDDFGPLTLAIGNKGYINQTNDPENFFVYY